MPRRASSAAGIIVGLFFHGILSIFDLIIVDVFVSTFILNTVIVYVVIRPGYFRRRSRLLLCSPARTTTRNCRRRRCVFSLLRSVRRRT